MSPHLNYLNDAVPARDHNLLGVDESIIYDHRQQRRFPRFRTALFVSQPSLTCDSNTKVKVHSSARLPAFICFTLPNRSCTDPPCPQEVWPLLPPRLLPEPRGCSLSLSLLCSSPACRPRVPRLPWMAVTGPTEVTSGSQPQAAMAATDDVIHFCAEIPRPARDLLTSSKYSVTSTWWWVEQRLKCTSQTCRETFVFFI